MKKLFTTILVLSLPFFSYAQENTNSTSETELESTDELATKTVKEVITAPVCPGCRVRIVEPYNVLSTTEPDRMMLLSPKSGVAFNRQYLRYTPRY